MTSKGLFVPVSKETEWLLKWWWLNYTLNCSLPITFIKEGKLSDPCEKWCVERSSHQEFDTTLWISPWCQIRGSLDPLFLKSDCEAQAAIPHRMNFDIFTFKKDSTLLQQWDDKEEFFNETSLKFNLFSFAEVDDKLLDSNPEARVLNWQFNISELKDYLSIVEKDYLINLSFK